MPNFLDFIERANSGPTLTEKDFNMGSLIPNVRDLVKEYDISLDKENPISSDDAMADRLWKFMPVSIRFRRPAKPLGAAEDPGFRL